MSESKFVDAIALCDQIIQETSPTDDKAEIIHRLEFTQQINDKFCLIKNSRLIGFLQNTISSILKK